MLPPSPAVPLPVSPHRAPSWVSDYHDNGQLTDHSRQTQSQHHQFSYYDIASYAHIPSSTSQLDCTNLVYTNPTSSTTSSHDVWQYELDSIPSDYFNAGSFYYQPDLSALQTLSHFSPGTHYPSDHLQPQYLSGYSIPGDTSVDTTTPIYHNAESTLHTTPHSASASISSSLLPESEATRSAWAKLTGSEHGLAAFAGERPAASIEPQECLQSPTDSVFNYPAPDPYPSNAATSYRSTQKYTTIAPSQPSQRTIDAPPYRIHHQSLPNAYPDVQYRKQHVYHNAAHEFRESQGQEPDSPLMDHLPYLEPDASLHALGVQPKSPTNSSSSPSCDGLETRTPRAHTPSENPPLSPVNGAPPSNLTVAIAPGATTTEEQSPHDHGPSGSQTLSSRSPRPSKTHAQRLLARQQRPPSPRMTLRPPSRASLRLTPLPGIKRQLERKPPLACLFCRARKIACGAPAPGSTDKTCNQCARRSLKCEYPSESRRGLRKKKSAVTTAPAEGSHSGDA